MGKGRRGEGRVGTSGHPKQDDDKDREGRTWWGGGQAISVALQSFPEVNSRLADDGNSLRLLGSHNVGIAMDTPRGLVVRVMVPLQCPSDIPLDAPTGVVVDVVDAVGRFCVSM